MKLREKLNIQRKAEKNNTEQKEVELVSGSLRFYRFGHHRRLYDNNQLYHRSGNAFMGNAWFFGCLLPRPAADFVQRRFGYRLHGFVRS